MRDALTEKTDPVYGLQTVHGCLKQFLTQPVLSTSLRELKTGSHVFGLIAMAKFILRLPAEVLDEELPNIKDTIVQVCVPNLLCNPRS